MDAITQHFRKLTYYQLGLRGEILEQFNYQPYFYFPNGFFLPLFLTLSVLSDSKSSCKHGDALKIIFGKPTLNVLAVSLSSVAGVRTLGSRIGQCWQDQNVEVAQDRSKNESVSSFFMALCDLQEI